jgi:lipopolysaccharide transport system permease protein
MSKLTDQKALSNRTSADSPAMAHPSEPPVLMIEPPKGWGGLGWAELVRYRELLYFMVWRDFKIRYKQTVLGTAWAIIQPLFSVVVFTIIFGRLAGLSSEGFPFPLFVFAGLLPWNFFSSGVSTAGVSLVSQQDLLTKVYFPRLFVPASAIGTCLVDFAIASVLFGILLVWYGTMPSWQIVFVPILLLFVILATLGLGFLLSAITVTFRDLRLAVPFLMQALMYLSPVVYAVSIVPPEWHWVLALNPMAGLIDGFRSAILGKPWNFTTLGVSCSVSVLLFVFGTYKFRMTEQKFADIV